MGDVLTKRLIACFDVVDGRVTKARQFEDNIDVGPADEIARDVYAGGIDEIIFYDILASAQRRAPDIAAVRRVAEEVFVPFAVGGGVRSLDDMLDVLDAGAEKVSVDSMAVRHPEIIEEGAREFGRQAVLLSMQVKRREVTNDLPSGYEIMIDGARTATGIDAVEWAKRGTGLGAGEVCVNSIDGDGTHAGYDLAITKAIAEAVDVPVIASGGAGAVQHLVDAFTIADASAAIISSLLYSPRMERNSTVRELKDGLVAAGVSVRPTS
ncbi:MAG TPA: HisA/HisF-related TIM barrel protein [Acidimicrobiales bacterium]|nr:HisA/HisF-related TIM barrel protein [Acidimicrobiales bacterium]